MAAQCLTLSERERIELYLRTGKKKLWIAKKLGRDYSVIRREIDRNKSDHLPCTASDAQALANRKAKKTNIRKLEKPKRM